MTVADTKISPNPAAAMIRAAVWTAIPRTSPAIVWTRRRSEARMGAFVEPLEKST